MQLSAAALRRSTVTLGLAASLLLVAGPATSAWAQGGPNVNANERAHEAPHGEAREHQQDDEIVADEPRQDTDRRQDESRGAEVRSERAEGSSERPAAVRDGRRGAEAGTDASARADREERGGGQAGAATTPNRGSVKVRSTGDETWPPRNEPHPGCEFWLHFHGFDADEHRAFRLYAWSPTGDEQLVYASSVALTEARGNDYSAVYPAGDGLTLADLSLDASWPSEYEAHAQQGWHLRLEVDGPKHKMFWIACDGDASVSGAVSDRTDDTRTEDVTMTDGGAGAFIPEADRRNGVGILPTTEDEASGVGRADVTTEIAGDAFGLGGGDDADDAAVLDTILGGDAAVAGHAAGLETFGVGGTEPADDTQVLGVAGADDGTGSLPVTGAGLAWLALAGLVLTGTGAVLTRTRRATGATG